MEVQASCPPMSTHPLLLKQWRCWSGWVSGPTTGQGSKQIQSRRSRALPVKWRWLSVIFRRRRGISETKAYQKIGNAVTLNNGLVTNTTRKSHFLFVTRRLLCSLVPYTNWGYFCSVEMEYFVAHLRFASWPSTCADVYPVEPAVNLIWSTGEVPFT